MRDYELVTVISPEVDEDGVGKVVERVGEFISQRGGVVEATNNWGRKKLAYPIGGFLEADYVLTRFKLGPASVKEVEGDINALGDVLRYLVVRVEA